MTPEELDEATVEEAKRRWLSNPALRTYGTLAPFIAARMAREGWIPPEPGPDLLAFREWATERWPVSRKGIEKGDADYQSEAQAYLAGARMAREQERERANHPIAFAVRVIAGVFKDLDHAKSEASAALAKYRGEA